MSCGRCEIASTLPLYSGLQRCLARSWGGIRTSCNDMSAKAAGAVKNTDKVDLLSVKLLMCEMIQLLHEDCNACCHFVCVESMSMEWCRSTHRCERTRRAFIRHLKRYADVYRSNRRPHITSAAVCDANRAFQPCTRVSTRSSELNPWASLFGVLPRTIVPPPEFDKVDFPTELCWQQLSHRVPCHNLHACRFVVI